MLQLQPGEIFPIARQLDNASDASVYYLQTVIRNALKGTVLKTVNLTDNSNQYFTGSFNVPMDAIGNGYYITIITSVYTDAGYTQLSPVYSTTLDTFLIQQRFNTSLGYGGDSIVSTRELRKAIDEGFSDVKKTKSISKEDVSSALSKHSADLFNRLDSLKDEIDSSLQTQSPKESLKNILTEIASINKDYGKIESEGLKKEISQVKRDVETMKSEVISGLAKYFNNNNDLQNRLVNTLDEKMKSYGVIENSKHLSRVSEGITNQLVEVVKSETAKYFNELMNNESKRRKNMIKSVVSDFGSLPEINPTLESARVFLKKAFK